MPFAELDLFAGCDEADVVALEAAARVAEIEAGRIVYEQGSVATDLVIIAEGEADIVVNGRTIATVGRGQAVGEIGVIGRRPRTATVVARTPMTVYVVSYRSFDRLVATSPTLRDALLRETSSRVRALASAHRATG